MLIAALVAPHRGRFLRILMYKVKLSYFFTASSSCNIQYYFSRRGSFRTASLSVIGAESIRALHVGTRAVVLYSSGSPVVDVF